MTILNWWSIYPAKRKFSGINCQVTEKTQKGMKKSIYKSRNNILKMNLMSGIIIIKATLPYMDKLHSQHSTIEKRKIWSSGLRLKSAYSLSQMKIIWKHRKISWILIHWAQGGLHSINSNIVKRYLTLSSKLSKVLQWKCRLI